jgi:hypothetical protein
VEEYTQHTSSRELLLVRISGGTCNNIKFNSVKFFIYLHTYLIDLRTILKYAGDKEETKKKHIYTKNRKKKRLLLCRQQYFHQCPHANHCEA